jgi:alkylhydroperoxidase family enzyme
MQSRKHDSITDEDVACLIGDNRSDLDPQERMAIRFLDLLSADHHAIDADFYRQLGEVFTTAQVVELGVACSEMMGLHRFIHTLDVFGTGAPALPYDPSQVDTAISPEQTAEATA